MPNLDGTGPNGKGPNTGRGQGPCNSQEKLKTGFGQRLGLGRGMGRRNSNLEKPRGNGRFQK